MCVRMRCRSLYYARQRILYLSRKCKTRARVWQYVHKSSVSKKLSGKEGIHARDLLSGKFALRTGT